MTEAATPTSQSDRIGEVDIIRGFALFGVLWMNIFGHGGFLVPADKIHGLPGLDRLESVVEFLSNWLMHGKAQALFSLLFGFGFAIMMARISARGGNGATIYLRRLTILLVLGVAHMLLLWMGDILNAYAAMGFLLLLTRRWPGRLLLGVGLLLAMVGPAAFALYMQFTVPAGSPPPFAVILDAGAAARWPVVMGHDYTAYVAALFRGMFIEFYSQPIALVYLGAILGRFMVGSWIFRQGWLQDPAAHARAFRLGLWLIPVGLVLQGVRPVMRWMHYQPMDWALFLFRGINPVAELILALGYGSLIVVLCRSPGVRARLSGLGAVGQMALTNYLMQSLVFFFVLYGFGLGLLPWAGPTVSLGLSLVVFAAQIMFSRWWLARYRFGPMEWLWRWGTYGERPPFRRPAAALEVTAGASAGG
ncbi:DUF418 domain-containing protein [Brevundimonas sp. Root1279]|uniref:DUF418 domain-containing protein n=1 Tax=Brevundimonas sp. Root1279 TaxID=1736443 RepID=UPI000700B514|nr:DUF418 domain-containing protein [Brevundimonas sp. Root1279]KQW82257.1 hypothetical protein ASC65_08250 [Brevundimonas sp. Root1279]